MIVKYIIIGKAITEPTRADSAAPCSPYRLTSGTMGIISPMALMKVTNVTYSCFPTAKKSAEVVPDIALIVPKVARMGRISFAGSQLAPKTRDTISFGKSDSKTPYGMDKMETTAIV